MNIRNFPQRLLQLRVEAKLSQNDLAKKSGLGQKSISQWERGEREPTFAAVIALAQALEVDLKAFTDDPDTTTIRPPKGRPRKAEPEEECCAAA